MEENETLYNLILNDKDSSNNRYIIYVYKT